MRLPSYTRIAQKSVICRMKSAITASAATRQNEYSAGTLVSMPTKNASASQNAAVKIEGPISLSASATRFSIERTFDATSFSARTMMNMLSTPIASTKNGTTSLDISDKGMSA